MSSEQQVQANDDQRNVTVELELQTAAATDAEALGKLVMDALEEHDDLSVEFVCTTSHGRQSNES